MDRRFTTHGIHEFDLGYSADMFVKRERELALLEKVLIHDHQQVAVLYGHAGTGKTTLSRYFGQLHRGRFPGGLFAVYAEPAVSLFEMVQRAIPTTSEPSLLVIDEFDSVAKHSADELLARICMARPQTSILVVSGVAIDSPFLRNSIELAGLSQAQMVDIIRRRIGAELSPVDSRSLYGVLNGNLLAVQLAAGLIREKGVSVQELLEMLRSFEKSGLVGLDGQPLHEDEEQHKTIVSDVSAVNDELLNRLLAEPDTIYDLTPRKFEEVVAELLSRLGYEVTLTPITRDGGKDLYAAKSDALGTFLYIVECKKYAPCNPVGIDIVQRLYGVVQADRANAGVVATTSRFTRDAQKFQQSVAYQLSLKDYLDVQQWLREVLKGHR